MLVIVIVTGEALPMAVWATKLVTGASVTLAVLVTVFVVFGHWAKIASVRATPESDSPARIRSGRVLVEAETTPIPDPVTVVVSVWWTVVVDVTVVVIVDGAAAAGVGLGPGFGTDVGMSLRMSLPTSGAWSGGAFMPPPFNFSLFSMTCPIGISLDVRDVIERM